MKSFSRPSAQWDASRQTRVQKNEEEEEEEEEEEIEVEVERR